MVLLLHFVAMKPSDLLRDAKALPAKTPLDDHRETILLLRDKGYTWREIADFLTERGIPTDHTKVFRLVKKPKTSKSVMINTASIPTAETYERALKKIVLSESQTKMLGAHYKAHNRTVNYSELGEAAGFEGYRGANSQYGNFGKILGKEMGFEFADSDTRKGEKFHGSAIGAAANFADGEFQLVMHHELAKAIENLGWVETKKDYFGT